MDGNSSRICNCQSLASQQRSTTSNFLALNLKDFHEERRVEHLIPNQRRMPIEFC